jgi:hypothetical protein
VNNSIIAVYENMWLLTQQMLKSAQNGDWDALIEAELKRSALVDCVMAQTETASTNTVEQQKTGEIIQHILEADNEIRALAEAWQGELMNILGSIGIEKKLSKTYETP